MVMQDAARQVDARDVDAAPVTSEDAAVDAGCSISSGVTLALDGIDDLGKYPAAQHLTPGAMLGADAAAIAWDSSHLFVTLSSSAFVAAYAPLHVYVETGSVLATESAGQGKEYGGLVPALPFTPTHAIGARRVSDAGTGGYNGVYVPADQWQTRSVAIDDHTFVASDQRTLSVRVSWSALGGCPTAMRLALHVVHGVSANEWKDLVPPTHTPWLAPGGGFYEIDLTAAPAVSGWTLR